MENLFKQNLNILLFLSSIFLLSSCYKSAPDPVNKDISGVGWTVGMMDNNTITILHTGDGGMNWTNQTQLCAGFTDFQGISAVSEEVAWAVGGSANGYGAVIRTKDGGNDWCRVGKSTDIPNVTLYSIKAYDENQAWIVGDQNTLMHTVDGGLTWIKPDLSGLPATTFYAITQFGNQLWVAGTAADKGLVMSSSDGGNTWNQVGANAISGNIKDIQAINQNTLIASGSHQVLASHDAGNTWSNLLTLTDIEIRDVLATDIKNLWVITSANKIYHSADQGSTWSNLSLPVAGANFSGITGMNTGSIWIAGQKGDGSSVIMYSADRGVTWKEGVAAGHSMLTRMSFVSGIK